MCHLSEPLPVELGLPQGSILGPLMYTVYTNELPEVIHGHEPPETLKHKGFMFNLPCKDCGGVCCFADDSTFSISSDNPTQLNNSINSKYKTIANFMILHRQLYNDPGDKH